MREQQQKKVVRSYRLVFRRRWRIFRIQGWRIPLPGGIELRLLGYWLASLALIALLGRLPLFGAIVSAAPASLRLLAVPIAAAWLLSRWEIDGRPPTGRSPVYRSGVPAPGWTSASSLSLPNPPRYPQPRSAFCSAIPSPLSLSRHPRSSGMRTQTKRSDN